MKNKNANTVLYKCIAIGSTKIGTESVQEKHLDDEDDELKAPEMNHNLEILFMLKYSASQYHAILIEITV